MATVIAEMPETVATGRALGGSWVRPFLDGQIWKLVHGVDFHTPTIRAAQGYIVTTAQRYGYRAITRRDKHDPAVLYVQATKIAK